MVERRSDDHDRSRPARRLAGGGAGDPYAQALLPDGGAGVLLRVVPKLDPLLTELLWTLEAAPESVETAAVRTELERVKARVADTRVRWTTDVVRGDPAEEILRATTRHRIGLVAMTTHGRGGVRRWLLGSVADKLIREAAALVVLVRAVAPLEP